MEPQGDLYWSFHWLFLNLMTIELTILHHRYLVHKASCSLTLINIQQCYLSCYKLLSSSGGVPCIASQSDFQQLCSSSDKFATSLHSFFFILKFIWIWEGSRSISHFPNYSILRLRRFWPLVPQGSTWPFSYRAMALFWSVRCLNPQLVGPYTSEVDWYQTLFN